MMPVLKNAATSFWQLDFALCCYLVPHFGWHGRSLQISCSTESCGRMNFEIEEGCHWARLRNTVLKPWNLEVDKLNIIAVKRQQEQKDVDHSDCNSRNLVEKCHGSLYCLQHPDDRAYTLNRNLIYKKLHQVATGISKAAHATASDDAFQHHGGGVWGAGRT